MARVSGTNGPFLLADDSDRIIGMRSGDIDRYFLLTEQEDADQADLEVDTLTVREADVVGAFGEAIRLRQSTLTLTGLTGATATATYLIPAGAIVLGVTTRIVTAITGPTDFDIGYSGAVNAFGDAIAVLTANATTGVPEHTGTGPLYFANATSVLITANGGNFTAGAMRITAHYLQLVPATS